MGNSVHYTYDQEGYLNGILDNESNILESITYNHAEGEDQHKVYSKTDIYGNVFTYSYDNINKKVTITDSNGKTNVKWYDDSMFIIQDSDPEGKLTITEYFTDANVKNNYGEEKSVTDRNGNKTQYQRDGNGNITKITNPDSSTQVFTYDSKNNLLSEKDETGKSVYYVYDASQKNLIKEARPHNGTDVYTQSGDQSKFAITSYEYYTDEESQQLSFNALGLLKSVTDPEGNTVYYSYDPSGNLSTITDPQGNSTENTYNGFGLVTKTVTPEGYATTSVYDLNGRLEKQVLDGGETARILYDHEGRKVKEVSPKLYSSALDDIANHSYAGDHGDRYTYYENGKISTFTDSENRVTSYGYDLYGNLLSETKPDGTIYSYEYDSINRPVKVWFQENESAQPVLLEEYIYEILSDKKTKRTVIQYLDSSNFTKTEYTYDYADRLLIQKNNDNSTLQTSYFANGQVNTTTDANGSVTTYIYDGLNRLIEKRTPFEKIGSTTYFTVQKYTYDANGNVLEEKITRNVPGQTEVYATKKYSYDSLNRLVMVTQMDNGSPVNYVQYYYDADGNQVRMYTGLSSPLTINGLDNVTSGGDQDFSVTRYSYNHMGKLTGYTDPLGKSETYAYDSNGNLISQTDRNGNVLTYTYDNLNRMLTKNVTSSDSSKNVSYTYAYNIGGNLESEAGGYTDVEYDYDPMGRLITETEALGVIKEYSYDLAGNRTSFKLLVDGVLKTDLSYTYDNMQRLYEVKENGTATATYLYDINGNRLSLTYVNGNSTTYSYNLANKLKVLTNKQNGTDISKYTYSYTLAGNQVSKKDLANITTSYSYDDLGRLTSETREGITTAYQYDDYNNRKSMEITGGLDDVLTEYVYDDNNRLITEIKTIDGVSETTTYSYDDNGNQIGKGSSAYKYDGLNRLIEAVEGGQTYNYTYYSYDLRATKSVGGSTTVHIWDGQEIAGELDENGVLVNRYIRGINLIAADDGSAQNRKYYLYNGHSDVVQLTGTSGNVIKTYDYDAFGNELNPDPNDTNVFRYSGEYFDKETGKIYVRARYYDPAIGRFISEDSVWGKSNDPLSLNLYTYAYNNPPLYFLRGTNENIVNSNKSVMDPQSLNLYIYCGNNPINRIDPTGHSWEDIWNGVKSFGSGTVDFVQGVGSGVLESISYGTSNNIEVYYYRDNDTVYLIGKVVGDTVTGVVGGVGTVASGTFTVVSAPTVAGAVAGSAATAYCGSVTVSAAANAASNVMKIVNGNGGGGGGDGPNFKLIKDNYLKKNGIDAHELKSDFVGNKNISKYDLYQDTNTGEIYIFQKGGKGEGIATGEFIK